MILSISLAFWSHTGATFVVSIPAVYPILMGAIRSHSFGIVTCMANAQLGYKYGFVGITPGITLMLAMYIVGKTGFCIKPLRDNSVITVPELFDKKFGRKVRWASGVVIVLGGLLNMGVFLRMAGDFLITTVGIGEQYLELLMTLLLLIVALYTILGGMLSVLVTDYLQFIVMSIGLVSVSLLFFFQFGWDNMVGSLQSNYGPQAFNPFHDDTYPIERIILDILIAFSSVLT